jgi:hypothetical protein
MPDQSPSSKWRTKSRAKVAALLLLFNQFAHGYTIETMASCWRRGPSSFHANVHIPA